MGAVKMGRGLSFQRVLAAIALSDVAYRLLAREPLRRALGVQRSHA